jgi:hypothetical protein
MGYSPRRLLGLLGVVAVTGAIMIPLPVLAGFSAPTLTIAKDCAGLAGEATLDLSVARPDIEAGSVNIANFSVTVECGKTVTVLGIPGEGGTQAFSSGDTITISEDSRPSISILPAAETSVTLTALPKSVTVVDPPAVSIKKTCGAGVTGQATFNVSNSSAESHVNIDVPCGATVPVELPAGSLVGQTVVIHESTPATNGVAAANVTVTIPQTTPVVASIANNAAVSATPTPSATPTAAVLAQTGTPRTPQSQLPVLLAAMVGGTAVILLGLVTWRRRRA